MKEKSAESGPHAEAIADELTRLCDELHIVNDTLAEIRQDIAWGIRNELIYETGRVQVWGNVIRKVGRVPLPDREPEKLDVTPPDIQDTDRRPSLPEPANRPTGKQLELF